MVLGDETELYWDDFDTHFIPDKPHAVSNIDDDEEEEAELDKSVVLVLPTSNELDDEIDFVPFSTIVEEDEASRVRLLIGTRFLQPPSVVSFDSTGIAHVGNTGYEPGYEPDLVTTNHSFVEPMQQRSKAGIPVDQAPE